MRPAARRRALSVLPFLLALTVAPPAAASPAAADAIVVGTIVGGKAIFSGTERCTAGFNARAASGKKGALQGLEDSRAGDVDAWERDHGLLAGWVSGRTRCGALYDVGKDSTVSGVVYHNAFKIHGCAVTGDSGGPIYVTHTDDQTHEMIAFAVGIVQGVTGCDGSGNSQRGPSRPRSGGALATSGRAC